jgi:hypothetical protein
MVKDCNRFINGIDMFQNCTQCEYQGDCGQQNCWHGCLVCRYNNMDQVCVEGVEDEEY